ncbi:MAG: hypothetical protein JWN86_4539, partial [Planctomycetota bacterium]|nr:hypothetical protein [Planctomycetota bacterium]
PARDTLVRAQAKFNDVRLDDPPPGPTVGSVVAEKLAQAPFDKIGVERVEAGFSVPLNRVWDRTWSSPVRPLAAEGVPPSPAAVRVFVVEKNAIRPVDLASGASSWHYDMGTEPEWVGYLGDRVMVASSSRVVALDLGGRLKWQYPADATRAARPVANPFSPAGGVPGAAADRRDPPIGRLHGFRVVGGRLFCQRGDQELIALDGETGGVDWAYAPANGGINENLWVGLKRVVLQLAEPETLVVLDTDTGRRREFPRSAKDKADEPAEPWARPPLPIDDDHVCIDIDPRTVALLDLTTGKRSWTSSVTTPSLPRNGPPRILGDSNRLLVVYEGNELIRVNPATGRQLWSRSLGLEDLSGAPDAFALDGDRFYCATGATLTALNLNDGEPLWTRALLGPPEGWSLALSERYVTAYPSPTRSTDGPLDGLSLVVCRRDDGVLVQRFSFPASVSQLTVRLLSRGALVATQGGVWVLGEPKVVDGPRPPR